MVNLKVGSKAIIVNSEHHPEENCKMCEILEMDVRKSLFLVQVEGTDIITTMWVKQNELIPILYEKKENIEKYGNLEQLYELFAEYKGYYDFICKVAEDECNRAERLTKENQELQCKIEEMQKYIDCMKAEIGELRNRCHESARDNFDNKLYGLLHIVGREELKTDENHFHDEPIKVAEMLIDNFTNVSVDYVHSAMENGISYSEETFNELHRQEVKLLRQIAEHLLVYCNAEEK